MSRWVWAATCFALISGTAFAAENTAKRTLSPFVLDEVSGEAYDVGPHIGKDVLVIAFWATWCKPCKLELAALHKLYKKYREKGLTVLAVSIDGPESIAEVVSYKKKYSYTFPILLDNETAVLERYNPRGDVPFSMVVDKTGAIVAVHQGYNPGDEIPLEKKLLKLMAAETAGVANPDGGSGTSYSATNSFQLRYLIDNSNGRDNDDGVFGLVNKLTVGTTNGPFSTGVRMDNVSFPFYDAKDKCKEFSDPDDRAANCQWDDDHRVERVWAHYRTRPFELRVGDYYHSVGRGLVFSVRKIDELGLDTAVRGGRARGRLGPVTIQAFGGRSNVQNFEIENLGFVEDPDDLLAGGDLSVSLPGNVTLGARGMYVDYEESPGATKDEGDWTTGGSIEVRNLFDMVNFYAEGAYIENLKESLTSGKVRNAPGHGIYASLSVNPVEGLAILLEFKDYRRFKITKPNADKDVPVVYHEPPTLERFDQIVPEAYSGTGGRLLVEYFVKPLGMLVYANGLYYGYTDSEDAFDHDEDVDNFDSEKGRSVLHTYLGVEKRWSGGLYVNVSGGWRNEGLNEPLGDAEFSRRVWHVESDIQVPVSGKHAVGMRTNHRSEERPIKDKEFMRGDVAITYSYAPQLSLGLLYTYQTESEEFGSEFLNFAGEGVWRFSDWGQINIFGGRITGGLICVSGVCRTLPPFYGVKSEFVARF